MATPSTGTPVLKGEKAAVRAWYQVQCLDTSAWRRDCSLGRDRDPHQQLFGFTNSVPTAQRFRTYAGTSR
jgi:hypothetical protein